MTLFFTRRALNTKKNQFTDNPSTVTRYVSISGKSPKGKWSAHLMERDDWLAAVGAEAKSDEVVIYVHGFNTKQKDMLNRHAKIEAGLRKHKFKGAVIAYDWPSDGSVFNYPHDRLDAKKTAQYLLSDGIFALKAAKPEMKIHLLAHSMGGYLTLRALSSFGDGAAPGKSVWSLDEVMYVSGDCDRDWFVKGAWGGLVLNRRAERFTNYYSGADKVLDVSGKLINGAPRVGHTGMPADIHSAQWDIFSDEQYKRDVPKSKRKLTYSHTWWFDNDGFYKDVAQTLKGVPSEKITTRKKTNVSDLALLS